MDVPTIPPFPGPWLFLQHYASLTNVVIECDHRVLAINVPYGRGPLLAAGPDLFQALGRVAQPTEPRSGSSAAADVLAFRDLLPAAHELAVDTVESFRERGYTAGGSECAGAGTEVAHRRCSNLNRKALRRHHEYVTNRLARLLLSVVDPLSTLPRAPLSPDEKTSCCYVGGQSCCAGAILVWTSAICLGRGHPWRGIRALGLASALRPLPWAVRYASLKVGVRKIHGGGVSVLRRRVVSRLRAHPHAHERAPTMSRKQAVILIRDDVLTTGVASCRLPTCFRPA